MDNLLKVLQAIFYLIWIPLGLVLLALAIYLIIANPLQRMMGPGGPPSSGFENRQQGGQQGNFEPSKGGFGQQEGFGGPPQQR